MKSLHGMRWLLVAGGAATLLAAGTGGVLAAGGPPMWAPGSGSQLTQQERQRDMLQLHEQLGVPAGQQLQLHDGLGPHGPGGGPGPGATDCPYHATS